MRRLMPALSLFLLLAGCAGRLPAYVVFFEPDSDQVQGPALGVVREAAEAAGPLPTPVRLLGYADPEGAPAANRALSAARARAVADRLIAEGVARERIRIEPRGETPYADAAQESRRVEIRIGG